MKVHDSIMKSFPVSQRQKRPQALVGQKVGRAVGWRWNQEFFKSLALNNENITQMECSPWKRYVPCLVFLLVRCCVEKGHMDFRQINVTPGHSDLEHQAEVGGPRRLCDAIRGPCISGCFFRNEFMETHVKYRDMIFIRWSV